jgi:hypothetical protein
MDNTNNITQKEIDDYQKKALVFISPGETVNEKVTQILIDQKKCEIEAWSIHNEMCINNRIDKKMTYKTDVIDYSYSYGRNGPFYRLAINNSQYNDIGDGNHGDCYKNYNINNIDDDGKTRVPYLDVENNRRIELSYEFRYGEDLCIDYKEQYPHYSEKITDCDGYLCTIHVVFEIIDGLVKMGIFLEPESFLDGDLFRNSMNYVKQTLIIYPTKIIQNVKDIFGRWHQISSVKLKQLIKQN